MTIQTKSPALNRQALLSGGIATLAAFLAIPLVPTAITLPSDIGWAFYFFGLVESLGVGGAVAFAVAAWRRLFLRGTDLEKIVYLAVIVQLGSWWPHGRAHAAIGHEDWGWLAIIEAGFHVIPILLLIPVAMWVLRMALHHAE